MHKRYKNLTKKCLNCGSEFNPWIGRPNSKFCGSKCSIEYRYKQDNNLGKKLTVKAHEAIRNGNYKKERPEIRGENNPAKRPEVRKKISEGRIGENNPCWNSGKHKTSKGYIVVLIGKNRYKEEHILVAEKKIGRKLKKNEVVHHINGVRDDNRPSNLLVMTRSEHTALHMAMRRNIS